MKILFITFIIVVLIEIFIAAGAEFREYMRNKTKDDRESEI